MLLCYVIDSGLSTSLLLLATLIIMFYIYITLHLHCNEIPPRDKNDEFTMRLCDCDYGPTVVGLQELLYYNDHTSIDLLMHVHGLIKIF